MKKTFIYSLVVAAFLVGCGDDKGSATKAAVDTTKAAQTASDKVTEGAKAVASNAVDAVKEKASSAVEATKAAVSETASSAVEATKDAAAKVADTAKEAGSAVAEKATAAVSGAVAAATGSADGKAKFAKCVACHGAKAEKKALGASQVIAGWDAAKVEEALHGYKAGTYGGSMKGVMKGQVASMSDADIKAVAGYISGLK